MSGCNYTEVSGQTYLLHSCQRVSPEYWLDQLFPTALLLEIRSFNTRSVNSVDCVRVAVSYMDGISDTVARTLIMGGGGGDDWWRTHQQIRGLGALPKK